MPACISQPGATRSPRSLAKSRVQDALDGTGKRRYCVFYLKEGREHRSPWFNVRRNADRAFALLSGRYGRATVYVD